MMTLKNCFITCLLLVWASMSWSTSYSSHAIALHGKPKYNKWFSHFDYTNPYAPKGGIIRLATPGSFDSLNLFVAKGNPASEAGIIYDTLTVQSADEPFTEYGLLAKTIEWSNDRTWIKYTLRNEARFHDGTPVTAADVKFTFDTLKNEGHPYYKLLYDNVKEAKINNRLSITFTMPNANNRELIMLIGQLPVLPKHYWKDKNFQSASLDIPLGSGPYKIKSIDIGKNIVLERVPNYWARNLAVNKGKYNFDTIRYDYYRDSTILLEALKANAYDFRLENVSKQWATGYSGTPFKKGWLIKEDIKHQNPTGMQCFLMNQRNPLFNDIRVRQALNYAFDFEWTNKTLFYNAYKRNHSFFSNSELASSGLPSKDELELLLPLKKWVPKDIFKTPIQFPSTNGSGNNREQLKVAKKLLEEAGWKVQNNVLTNEQGVEFKFEFLLFDPSFERIINPYIHGLKKLGIQATVRRVETSQYINQLRTFNFDIIVHSFSQTTSPGNELIQYWHSSTADTPASLNLAGIKNKAVDNLIDNLIESSTREDVVTAAKALDRVMLYNWYVISQWHIDTHRIAYWDKFSRPKKSPKYDTGYSTSLMTWWFDTKKSQSLTTAKEQ